MKLKLENSQVGPYRITRHLRDGSFSRVYVARGPGGGDVVIKALNPPGAAGGAVPYEQIVSHFENEIAVMQEVRHENVVRLIQSGVGRDDEGVEFRYIACEYV